MFSVPHQVLGPFAEEEEFSTDDFHLLEKLTLSTSADKIKAKVKQMSLTPKKYAPTSLYFEIHKVNVCLPSKALLKFAC